MCKDNVVVYHEFYQDHSAERTDTEGRSKIDTWSWQWATVTEEFNGKSIYKTVRKKISCSVSTLKEAYNKNIQAMCTHLFNINHQCQVCKVKKEQLYDDEVFLHIDIAENWTCKRLDQIQSANFGGSKTQVTLHTGVAYVGGKDARLSFCSIRGNNTHNPQAISSHLELVLVMLKTRYPTVQKIHFLSDGPVTQ